MLSFRFPNRTLQDAKIYLSMVIIMLLLFIIDQTQLTAKKVLQEKGLAVDCKAPFWEK